MQDCETHHEIVYIKGRIVGMDVYEKDGQTYVNHNGKEIPVYIRCVRNRHYYTTGKQRREK